jgi:flagellar motor switch protein FliG
MMLKQDALRRAAILVGALDTTSADELLDQMPREQADEVRRLVVELEDVDPREEQTVIADFLTRGLTGEDSRLVADQADGVELCISASSVAAETCESVEVITAAEQPLRTRASSTSFLEDAASERLVQLIATERPQTIAVVISQLSEPRAIEVLTALPDSLQCEVLRRWIELDAADPELVREIEAELQARMVSRFGGVRRLGTGLAQVTGVVQAADPHVQQQLLSHLALYNATVAAAVTTPRLSFDDLEYLSDAGLAELVAAAEPRALVLALAGATESFAERVARQLPPAESKRLLRSINSLGPTRLADVEAAQRELAAIAEKLLARHDVIELPSSMDATN